MYLIAIDEHKDYIGVYCTDCNRVAWWYAKEIAYRVFAELSTGEDLHTNWIWANVDKNTLILEPSGCTDTPARYYSRCSVEWQAASGLVQCEKASGHINEHRNGQSWIIK